MAASLRLDTIRQDAAGHVYISYGDGVTMEFLNKAAALEWVNSIDAPAPETIELLRKLIVKWWLRRDPAGNTPSLVQGKTLTMDLTATPPFTIT